MKLNKTFFITSAIYMFAIVAFGVLVPFLLGFKPLILFQILFTAVTVGLIRLRIYQDIQTSLIQINRVLISYTENEMPPELLSDISENSLLNIKLLEQHFFSMLSKYQSMIKSKQDLVKELDKSNQLTRMMLDLSHSIINLEDPQVFYEEVLHHAISIIENATHGSVSLLNDKNQFEFLAIQGYDDSIKSVKLDLTKTFLWVKSNGDMQGPVVIEDISEFNKQHLTDVKYKHFNEELPDDIQTTISAPIMIEGKIFGMINVDSGKDHVFTKHDVSLMDYFSKQTSIAIKNRLLVEKSMELSRFDLLTMVFNRPYFEAQMHEYIKRSKRYKDMFSIARLDFVHLKQINEEHGIKKGDELLKLFTALTRKAIRDSDLFGRIGGDEFAIVFLSTSAENTELKVLEIIRQVEGSCLSTLGIKVALSFGIVEFSKDGTEYEALIRKANERSLIYKRKLNI
jgi:diguanylate cyclase (GGDEF)-like protein